MGRIYNFSAGPSMLPLPVLESAQRDMLNYGDSGMSVMEMSHRSPVYDQIIQSAEALLRSVMGIPNNYKVLFLQGGATLQFAMLPANLLANGGCADYVLTGSFSAKAYEEALALGKDVAVAASTKSENFSRIPSQKELSLRKDAAYVHICSNNTIYGSHWQYVPNTGNVPLVADMSSCILSQPIDVSKYGIIYAGAQKNIAPAGLTVVIIREDLLCDSLGNTPTMLNYATMAKNNSMYNTPPCWPIYITKLVLEWIEQTGGLAAMHQHNTEKAALLYNALDASSFYKTGISKADRSLMNATFSTGNTELDALFAKQATAAGLSNLKGHRAVGGMRASIYNAMPKEGVQALVSFMQEFERTNG